MKKVYYTVKVWNKIWDDEEEWQFLTVSKIGAVKKAYALGRERGLYKKGQKGKFIISVKKAEPSILMDW